MIWVKVLKKKVKSLQEMTLNLDETNELAAFVILNDENGLF